MKSVAWLPSSCALILILAGCANKNDPTADNGPGYGPFDSQGRYREEWADDPSKWSRPGKRQQQAPADDLPVVAKNEQPPADANPLAPQVAMNSKPTVREESKPRETSRPRETTRSKTTVAQAEVSKPKPKSTESKEVTSKPKPKSTVVKVKPKPKTNRYVVKQGDSLSKIASRNGSSVSAIQKANGISGTLIHPGQSLVIPKR